MRRIGRWVFNLLAGLSLLTCLATAGMWVRSHWMADATSYCHGNRLEIACTYNGALVLQRSTDVEGVFTDRKGWLFESETIFDLSIIFPEQRFGFAFHRIGLDQDPIRTEGWIVQVPL